MWTHTWYDPAKEKETAKILLQQGADVLAHNLNSVGTLQAAEEGGAYTIGFTTDESDIAPKAYLTAPIWNWGTYYVNVVQSIIDGTWSSGNYWGGMQEGIVDLAPLTTNVEPGTATQVDKAKTRIFSAPNMEFEGSIMDQSGKIGAPEGATLSDSDQLRWIGL